MNIQLVKTLGVGKSIKHPAEVGNLMKEMLLNPQFLQSMKNGFDRIPKNQFGERIIDLIQTMVDSKLPVNKEFIKIN